jgi:hypothetical protein
MTAVSCINVRLVDQAAFCRETAFAAIREHGSKTLL